MIINNEYTSNYINYKTYYSYTNRYRKPLNRIQRRNSFLQKIFKLMGIRINNNFHFGEIEYRIETLKIKYKEAKQSKEIQDTLAYINKTILYMYLYVKKEIFNLKMIFSKSGFVGRFGKKKKGN